jgi:hypothetical protein
MRVHLIAASAAIAIVLGGLGCGSYSAPNNPTSTPDSPRDTTTTPPPYNRS